MTDNPYTGIWPVATTPFHDDGSLDPEGMKRVLDTGATGTMTSAMIPDLIGPVVRDSLAGDRSVAIAGYGSILPAVNHENCQCGFRAAKAAMIEGGVIASDFCRHPIAPLHPDTRAMLMALLRPLDLLVLRWGH